jgi:hypothetical protein
MVLADEPKITDWLSVWFSLGSGVVALLALIAAAIAVRATIQTNRTQTRQLQKLEEAQERDLANRVAVWVEVIDVDVNDRRSQICFHNGGPLPIYRCAITLYYGEYSLGSIDVHTLPPTTQTTIVPRANKYLYDALMQLAETVTKTDPAMSAQDTFDWYLNNVEIELEFRFNVGSTRWTRDKQGNLQLGF